MAIIRLISFTFLTVLLTGYLGFTYHANADFNKQINYQGKLRNASNNTLVSDNNYNIEFKLYTVPTGGVAVWTETRTVSDRVALKDGLFSVLLGEVSNLDSVNFNQTLYLGVTIGSTTTEPTWDTEMTPRKKLGAVPAALISATVSGTGQSSVGTTTPVANASLTAEATSTNSIALVVRGFVGQVANLFEIVDNFGSQTLVYTRDGNMGIGTTSPYTKLAVAGTVVADNFIATSTVLASTFPYASTTALTVSGTASTTDIYVSGNAYLSNFTGILQGTNGTVSASSTLSVAYGGTGLSTLPTYGQLLLGNANGGYTLTSTSSLGLLSFSTTSADVWYLSADRFSTTSADYWKTENNFYSTTSADYWLAQNTGSAFSTTSADYWSSLGYGFSTTSSDYWLTQNVGSAFSTTSANHWSSLGYGFSTTSTDYWKTENNFYSTTSADHWLAQNTGNAFSTTSADNWYSSSTTLPTLAKLNTWTGLNIFSASTTFQAQTNLQQASTTMLTVAGNSYLNGTNYLTGDTYVVSGGKNIITLSSNGNLTVGKSTSGHRFEVAYGDSNDLSANIIPNMVADNSPSPYVASVSSSYNGDYPAWKAFDGGLVVGGTEWVSQGGGGFPQWLKIDLGEANAVAVTAYKMWVRDDVFDPTEWTFQGSNNGSTWTTLDSQTGQTVTGSAQYSFNNTTAYRYYQLVVTASGTDAAGLTELQMYTTIDAVSALVINASNGNVGIATTSPYSKLTVWGSDTEDTILANFVNSASTSLLSIRNNGLVTTVNSTSTLGTITTFWSTLANITDAIFTSATTTNLGVNSETFTDLTGVGLQNLSGVLTLNATGDWTGTLDGYQGSDLIAGSFSTTSADYWSSLGYGFSTTSSDYWLTQNIGSAFSTTSANHWASLGYGFSTTSTDYWKTENNFYSTTSADNWYSASTTLPTLAKDNTWTGLNIFSASTTFQAQTNLQQASTTLFTALGNAFFTGIPTGSTVGLGSLYINPSSTSAGGAMVSWAAKTDWNIGDIGSMTSPAFADLDNDGDIDVMLGFFYDHAFAYKNTGTTASPTWATEATWDAPVVGDGYWSSPSFGDLDNDGDLDMLMGMNNGNCYGIENTGTVSAPTWSAKADWDTPVGANPTLADLDNDGDLDVLIGPPGGGVVVGYKNTGSVSAPTWSAEATWNTGNLGGNVHPVLKDLDGDGDYDLLVGSEGGVVVGLENTGTVSGPVWTANTDWDTPDVGGFVAPALADLDGDGDNDLLIGDGDGTTFGYENTGTAGSTGNTLFGIAVNGTQKFKVTGQGDTTIGGDLGLNGEVFSDLTGTGLQNSAGKLTLNATGDWTGTFDGFQGSDYIANSFSSTSADVWYSSADRFSSTTNDYWLGAFDKGYFFSTTSSDYWLTQNVGSAFSTTSANHWASLGYGFSTTSTDYWKTENNFYSTTSADHWLAQNTGNAFSTTSADNWYSSSSTLPTLAKLNTWTGLNIFSASTTFQAQTNLQQASTTMLTVTNNSYLGTTTISNLSVTNTNDSYILGNLGIGKNSAGFTLDVNGTFYVGVAGEGTFVATGGTITYTDSDGLNPRESPAYVGGYTVHTFTADDTLSVTGSKTASVLVVAGGGGGGWNYAAGGGAGGYRTDNSYSLSSGDYPVTVGDGGPAGTGDSAGGQQGENSVFGTITSAGGGGGMGSGSGAIGGTTGGSGGGKTHTAGTGFAGNTPETDPSQGNKGGDGTNDNGTGAGGGGAGGAGETNKSYGQVGGYGGVGVENAISGTATYYAGGGGGGGGTGGAGGNGGGGAGGNNGGAGEAGDPNTGGGGGGGGLSSGNGAAGGSGIVIVRYLTPTDVPPIYALNTTLGGYVGIGTTSPWGKLSVENIGTDASFVVGDEADDLSPFVIDNFGNVGIGTSSPYAKLSVAGTVVADNFIATSTTVASTFTNSTTTLGTITTFWSTLANITDAIFTSATTTNLGVNSETFTDLTGVGLQNLSGVLTLNATGDWTGTLDGYQGSDLIAGSFSTTSADYWSSLGYGFSTTSTNYWLTQNVGSAFSTTSANHWASLGYGFSTTSTDYWKTENNFYSTTSADHWLAQNTGNAFSTTSADNWYSSSSTLPTLAKLNTWTGLNIFSASTTFQAQTNLQQASTTMLTVAGNSYFPGGIWNLLGKIGIGTSTPASTMDVNGTFSVSGFNAVAANNASGGTITYVDSDGLNPRSNTPYEGGYTVHTFTGDGTFSLGSGREAEVMIVGGGGSGGGKHGGGGGGGGIIYIPTATLTSGDYTVDIGDGAPQVTNGADGSQGQSSVFSMGESAETALGGGGGSSYVYPGTANPGGNGGSGGGGAASEVTAGGSGVQTATNVFGTATTYKNNGGLGVGTCPDDWRTAGGGGGANVAGGDGGSCTGNGGNGGNGIQINIDGNNYYWGAGGGGGVWANVTTPVGGNGGLGGGGGGGHANGTQSGGTAGTGGTGGKTVGGAGDTDANGGTGGENTGSGGGGSGAVYLRYSGDGGAGGSGIVIVKYLTPSANSYFAVLNTTESGNVGIGTSSPYAKLAVAGAVVADNFIATSTTVASSFPYASTTALTVSGNSYFGTTTISNLSITNTNDSYSLGNFGVGTSSPWGALSVEMSTKNPSFVVSNEGSSTPAFYIGGVNQDGRIGIGTNNPSVGLEYQSNTPTKTDDKMILQGGYLSGAGGQDYGFYQAYNLKHSGTGVIWTAARIKAVESPGYGGQLIFETNSAPDSASTATTERLRLTANGNAGFGTSNPLGKLSINNYSAGANTTPLFVISSSTGALATSTLFTISSFGNVGIGTTTPSASLQITKTITPNDSNGYSIRLQADSDNTVLLLGPTSAGYGAVQAMDHSISWSTRPLVLQGQGGKVGIGTTTPGNMLTVQSVITTGDDTVPALGVNGGKLGLFNGGLYGLISGVLSTGSSFFQAQRVDGTATAYNILLQPSGGNVGIGTVTPNQGKLEVKGGTVCVDTNSDDNATSCIANESDVRLKENVNALVSSLELLKKLRPVSFDWKINDPIIKENYPLIERFVGQPHSYGFIAQEVQTILPEAISTETIGKDAYLQMNFNVLLPYIVGSIQEISASTTEMMTKLDVLIASSTINTPEVWVANSDGSIKLVSAQILDLQGQDIVNVRKIISANGKWSIDDTGVLTVEKVFAKEVETDKTVTKQFCIESTCINENDFKALLINSGIDILSKFNTSSTDNTIDSTPPTITLNGNNPANVNMNSMYSDMGATVTDNKDQNLGYTTSLWLFDPSGGGGTKISDNIENIDTSISAKYIIKYNAEDGAKNKAVEVERIVNVIDSTPVTPPAVEAPTPEPTPEPDVVPTETLNPTEDPTPAEPMSEPTLEIASTTEYTP